MKSFLFILVIMWFLLGAAAANDRGYFDAARNHNCSFVGTGLLTVVAGPLSYVGIHPKAAC